MTDTPPPARPHRGILLFGHGARDPQWALPFERIAARLRELDPTVAVQLGFLEFMQPDLPGAARQLVERGCTAVAIVPLFLGAGGHVRKDVPPLVDALGSRHPGTRFSLHPAIGEIPAVVDAMAQASLDALEACAAASRGR